MRVTGGCGLISFDSRFCIAVVSANNLAFSFFLLTFFPPLVRTFRVGPGSEISPSSISSSLISKARFAGFESWGCAGSLLVTASDRSASSPLGVFAGIPFMIRWIASRFKNSNASPLSTAVSIASCFTRTKAFPTMPPTDRLMSFGSDFEVGGGKCLTVETLCTGISTALVSCGKGIVFVSVPLPGSIGGGGRICIKAFRLSAADIILCSLQRKIKEWSIKQTVSS